jgi:NAD(P)-dependent dehydrogenase (short-subunit alcohol dehydrogenase family)
VLMNKIASLLKAGSRLVILSSAGHRFADVDLEDPNFDHTPYAEFVAYGRSKTANILFAVEFDRRHRSAGVRATAVHPGAIKTELSRHMTPEVTQKMIDQINATNAGSSQPAFQYKTVPQGAATSVWAGFVAEGNAVGGLYCEDCHVAEIVEGEGFQSIRGGVRPYALNADRAKALWAKSEEMVGKQF